jgi:hypothetical protein
MSIPPGVFTLSVDFELAWGEFYRGRVDLERLGAARRVFPDLLALLARRRIAATFAVVGHLLLEGCDGKHEAMPRGHLSWRPGDWYAGDPGSDEKRDPAWYAPSLVRALGAAEPGHDVGGHGFSHLPLDDPGVSRAVAQAEIAETARGLRAGAFAGQSFVFPRNGISHTQALGEQGFTCYRAIEKRPWSRAPKVVRKVAHMVEQSVAWPPPVGVVMADGAVVSVPSSMLFLSRQGFRRFVPMQSRVARALSGLARAAATGRVFHLWLHAEDLVPDEALMLAGLDRVLGEAERLAREGRIEVRTMAGLAAALAVAR